MMMIRAAAVDLGASSGRVSVVTVADDRLDVECVHRFPTRPVQVGQRLVWSAFDIYREIEAGLSQAAQSGTIDSIGIDTWGCDYGLVSPAGDLVGEPICYRDPRTTIVGADGFSAIQRVHEAMPPRLLYSRTGTGFQTYNSVYQLADDLATGRLRPGDSVLMMPDLVAYWLTGRRIGEVTIASTTGLIDPVARRLARDVADEIKGPAKTAGGLAEHWCRLVEPGTVVGPIAEAVADRTGLVPGTPVVAVASHDTASAVAALPCLPEDGQAAFISSGTWSLVGMELTSPILTEAGRQANFTNELGCAGRVTYLRNVMGLWVLNETMRVMTTQSLDEVLAGAAASPGGRLFDIDDPSLLPAGDDMPQRVCRLLNITDARPAQLVRAILDSLAAEYATAIRQMSDITGRSADHIHILGGGSQNRLLCQLTADATGLPVAAGPVEASSLGNGLVQSAVMGRRAGLGTSSADDPGPCGVTPDELARMRRLVSSTQSLTHYAPTRKGTDHGS